MEMRTVEALLSDIAWGRYRPSTHLPCALACMGLAHSLGSVYLSVLELKAGL